MEQEQDRAAPEQKRRRRAALYARTSTSNGTQNPMTQLRPLRDYVRARKWQAIEFVDRASGTKESRPGYDDMLRAVRRRKIDVVVCVKLDRLARSVEHLVKLGTELKTLGVDLVVLDQGIDTTTSTGRLLYNVLSSIAEFEHDLIVERVNAGLARARADGTRLGRPRLSADVEEQVRAKLKEGLSLPAVSRGITYRNAEGKFKHPSVGYIWKVKQAMARRGAPRHRRDRSAQSEDRPAS